VEIGVVLSIFNETQGFIPEYYTPERTDIEIVKHIIFRATLFLVGGADEIKKDRESMLELPEHDLFGILYMTSVESEEIRGGNMPLILILFFSSDDKGPVYSKIAEIIDTLKESAKPIKEKWNGSKFSDKRALREIIKEIPKEIGNLISDSERNEQSFEENISIFEVKCPECSSFVSVKVPKHIKGLLAIPVHNIPCKHEFEIYFTKGPELRGTSALKGPKERKEDIKDIFENL